MKKTLLLLSVAGFSIISSAQLSQKISPQDKTSFDAYKAESDGYFINFMETTEGIAATDNYASAIYLFKDGAYTILFSSPGCGRYMVLSPDKKSIGFKYIQPDGLQAPALLNVQTKQITLLHSPVDLCGQVSFSQNGKTAFTVGNDLIVNQGNSSASYSLSHYVNITPISPDGNFVCYNDDNDQLFLMTLLNRQAVKLTSGEKGNAFPVWSPDGSKLMYSSMAGGIYVYDMHSQASVFISEGQYPSWTDDSRHIIFTKLISDNFRLTGSDIYKAKCDGSGIINITNTPDSYEIAAIPAGSKIIYQSLNQKTVNIGSAVNGSFSSHLIYKIAGALNMNHQQHQQKSMLSQVSVPGTVPYVNQVYDTPEWHYGYGSCAPTTSIMAAAYYNKVPKWPIITNNGAGSHTSDYGAYVADKYRLDQYYFQDAATTGGGETAWGGYGYMWTGSNAPSNHMASYLSKHYMTSVNDAGAYATALSEINSGYPFPVCNLLTTAGHLILAIGYINGQHTLVFNDPYGNKNNGSWPNVSGANSHYDWPSYNNGNQNLNSVAWAVTAEGSQVAYNDTIIDDVFYNHGFYINNSQNTAVQGFYHDLNSGYNNHYWYTGTEAGSTDICNVTWTPTLAATGNYEIFAYIPGGAGSTAVAAKYQVHHSSGVADVVINQSTNSAQWVSLGIYSLDAGQTDYVYLGDATGTASQNIAFDAMKFRHIGPIDNINPTTAVISANVWDTTNFAASFTDADDIGGSGLEKSYYQVLDYDGSEWHANTLNGFFADNFDSYNAPVWSVPAGSGTWQVSSGNLIQNDSSSYNSNIYASVNQNLSNRSLYQFYAMIDPAVDGTNQHRFGFHFFSDNGALTNRGNSYFIYFREETSTLEFYKVVNDAFTLSKTVNNVTTVFGQWYDYKIIFDRTTGKISVYRDNTLLGTWTDSSVLTTQGNYVSFRTGSCKASISELKIYKSRMPSVTVTEGAAITNDIRYQNSDTATYSGKIKSIVNDAAGNLSAIASKNINVDWTPPSCVTVNDGAAGDIDTVYSISSLSANWTASADPNSGIAKYWYAVGTTAGASDVVTWTDNHLNTSVTNSGLSLTPGQVYYFSIKTVNGAGLNSICSSDGLRAEVTTGISENADAISVSVLPNPFTANAVISFSQKTDQRITITLTDILGKEIRIADTFYTAGKHSIDINADGLRLAKGVYTVRISSDHSVSSLRLIKY